MARLQELQYTVTGGTKVVSGVTLSPRSTRGYLRTSLRCKQESLRSASALDSISISVHDHHIFALKFEFNFHKLWVQLFFFNIFN